MAAADAYSRWVLFAKIALPMTALAILSTLFLFSGGIDPEAGIPFAKVDVEEIAREQRLTNARFGAVTEAGAAIALAAAVARPDPDSANIIRATEISGSIDLPGGAQILLMSGGALIDMNAQTAGLTDDVRVTSTTGLYVEAGQVLADFNAAELTSDGPVRVETPFGKLEAGNMLLIRGTESDRAYRLVFNRRVKLLYHPQE